MRDRWLIAAVLVASAACGSGPTDPTRNIDATRLYFLRTVLAGTQGPRLWASTPGDWTGSWSGHVVPDTAPTLSVSPDGRRLAYSDGRWIHLLDLASGHRVRLSPAWAEDRWPSWNGSSTRLLVTRTTSPSGAARLVSLGTTPGDSTAHAVLEAPINADPAWSPDGQRVVHSRWAYTEPLLVMDLDGGNHRELVPPVPVMRHRAPAWSPDGSRIASSVVNGSDGSGRLVIWTMDGGEVASLELTYAPTNLAWDPSGQRIAFCAYAGIHLAVPRYEVSVWDLRTGGREVITPPSASDCLVTWGRR